MFKPGGGDRQPLPARCRSLILVALLALAPLASAALPAPLPQGATGIGPGTHLLIDIGDDTFGCTAGWLWQDGSGYLLSAAGHCFLPEGSVATHGPGADTAGASRVSACVSACDFGGQSGFLLTGELVDLGPLAYARQTVGDDPIGNDFGLVRIPAWLVPQLRPDMPVYGKATLARDIVPGDPICFFGAGAAVGETSPTMARRGVGLMTLGDGSWRMAAPSAVGDSGAAVATCTPDGRAVAAAGVLTHLAGGMIAGTTMARSQEMAREAGLHVQPYL